MVESSAEVVSILHSMQDALKDAVCDRGAALVDRICLSGSLGRGTRAFDWEPCSLVLFLNIDLEFDIYEVPEALKTLQAALQAGLERGGWSSQTSVADPECRGGLWATLQCWRHFPAGPGADAALVAAPAADRGGTAGEITEDGVITWQLFLAENMSSSVAAGRQAGSSRDAALGDFAGSAGSNLDALSSVDDVKAREQQQRLLSRAERRQRHQVRHGDTDKSSAWAAKLSCSAAEAQRLFWSRQPQAALRAARAAHGVWQRIVAMDQRAQSGESAAREGDAEGVAASASRSSDSRAFNRRAASGYSSFLDDPFLHLLDVLALHATREVGTEGRHEEARPEEGAVIKHVFNVLSGDGGEHGLRMAMEGGILPTEDEGSRVSPERHGTEQGLAKDEEGSLMVLDPCFPACDLYAAACEALAQGGDVDSGRRVLRRLAMKAVDIIS